MCRECKVVCRCACEHAVVWLAGEWRWRMALALRMEREGA
jgi:hypothetical protein